MKVVKYERNLAKRLPLGGKLARKRLMRGDKSVPTDHSFPKKRKAFCKFSFASYNKAMGEGGEPLNIAFVCWGNAPRSQEVIF